MSFITEEIAAIELEFHHCLNTDSPIDTKKLKRLCDLRFERLQELVMTHDQRLEIMKTETRKMTEKLLGLNLHAKPDIQEKLLDEQDKYDKAAIQWVNDSSLPLWGASEAASIAAGILILAHEIC